jgi:hypothetical protein
MNNPFYFYEFKLQNDTAALQFMLLVLDNETFIKYCFNVGPFLMIAKELHKFT